ncbi:DUF5134 domain-containing protein [Streptomyces sp. NPDC048484]|uniref:DUF5134 domain-containing protein n=1 Tax=Streptomyces sp. NPDC048484 TaxID=3155146 RepID=UPI00341D9046
MHGPGSPGWLLVALCAATGAYCLLRMRSRVEEQRRTAGGEALMGFGMAAMAVPAAVSTPPRWTWAVYTAVFGVAALRALWAARTNAHHAHHLVGAFAMAYMAAVMASGAHSGVPVLTGVLLVYFTVYVLWAGTRLVPAAVAGPAGGSSSGGGTAMGGTPGGSSAGGGRTPGWGDRLELAQACRLSMGIGMLAMLLTL